MVDHDYLVQKFIESNNMKLMKFCVKEHDGAAGPFFPCEPIMPVITGMIRTSSVLGFKP